MKKIIIKNWDKYQGRGDVKKMHWFRFEVGFFKNPKFFELDVEQKYFFTWLMAYVTEYGKNGEAKIRYKYFVKESGVSEAKIKSMFSTLEEEDVLSVEEAQVIENTAKETFTNKSVQNCTHPNESERMPQDDSNPPVQKRALQDKTGQDTTGQDSSCETQEPTRDFFDPFQIVTLYNGMIAPLEGAKKASAMTGKSRNKLLEGDDKGNPALKEMLFSRDDWIDYFEKVQKSKVLHGRGKGRWKGFSLKLPFLVDYDNYVQIMDGGYQLPENENSSEIDDEYYSECERLAGGVQ